MVASYVLVCQNADCKSRGAGELLEKLAGRLKDSGDVEVKPYMCFGDGKATFATHGVFTYDREDRLYKLFWHDSLGYFAQSPASGGWKDNTLTLVRGSLRGNARHVYQLLDAGLF